MNKSTISVLNKLFNILLFIVTLYVNYLSVVFKIGGKSIRELSDKYDNLFTPSPSTFAIWSVIYLLIVVFLILQFTPKYAHFPVVHNGYFALSCLLNGAWIICWQFEYLIVSLIVMLGLLITLTIINKQLKEERSALLKLVFGVYLGWICIATVANETALLISFNWSFSLQLQAYITIAMLIISVIIVVWAMYQLANPFLSLAVSWALYGIYLKRVGDFSSIATVALVLAVLVLVGGWMVYRKNQLELKGND